MSSGKTHMLIGAVVGLGVARWLHLPLSLADPDSLLTVSGIGASAIIATIPDIDEPQSWIAQRVRFGVTLVCGAIGVLLGLILMHPGQGQAGAERPWETPWFVALALGFVGLVVVGPVLGKMVLRGIRRASGGHRRLTHSGLVASALTGMTWWLCQHHHIMIAMMPGTLAYSILVHDIGDIVTPAGVPLFYPLSSQRVGLPRPLAAYGERIVICLMIIVGYRLLRWGEL